LNRSSSTAVFGVCLVLLIGWAGIGCQSQQPPDSTLNLLVQVSALALDLPASDQQFDGLLRDDGGWCSGRRASYVGAPEAGIAVTVRLARFRDPATAARASGTITPVALTRSVQDRSATQVQQVDPPVVLSDAVVTAYDYGLRVSLEDREPDVIVVPVSLLVLQAGQVVAVVESIGLEPSRQETLLGALARISPREAARECWTTQPIAGSGATDHYYAAWGVLLLIVLGGVVLLPIAAVTTLARGDQWSGVTLGAVWLGFVVVLSLWLALA
jgi:hypothetical protein